MKAHECSHCHDPGFPATNPRPQPKPRNPKLAGKILISFYMIATKVEKVYDLYFPAEVRALLSTFSVWFSLGVEGIPLECVGAVGYERKLALHFTAPIVAVCIIVALVYVRLRVRRLREAAASRRTRRLGGHVTELPSTSEALTRGSRAQRGLKRMFGRHTKLDTAEAPSDAEMVSPPPSPPVKGHGKAEALDATPSGTKEHPSEDTPQGPRTTRMHFNRFKKKSASAPDNSKAEAHADKLEGAATDVEKGANETAIIAGPHRPFSSLFEAMGLWSSGLADNNGAQQSDETTALDKFRRPLYAATMRILIKLANTAKVCVVRISNSRFGTVALRVLPTSDTTVDVVEQSAPLVLRLLFLCCILPGLIHWPFHACSSLCSLLLKTVVRAL